MRRHALRDDQWERIKHLLPGREGSVGVTAADNRLFVEAVLYRYRAGIPWRDLPERFGDWKTCIDASAVGPNPVSGRRSSNIWPPMPTTNMRCSTAHCAGPSAQRRRAKKAGENQAIDRAFARR